MGIFPIGGQRVGIVSNVPVLDGGGEPTYQPGSMEPITTEAVVWVDGSLFEIQTPNEQQNLTVTTSEIAWAVMPVVDGQVPAVDDAGTAAPMAVADITANTRLRHGGQDYVMRGDAVLEQDMRGRHDHVFCVCEREQG